MMQKLTSRADAPPVRVVIVTMDTHVASAAQRVLAELQREIPGLALTIHAASEFTADPKALERCRADIAQGDVIVSAMLFLEDHFQPLLSALSARRENCDALVCIISAGEVAKLTRMGRFDMSAPTSGPMALLKRLRGGKCKTASVGAQQMKMLRRLPKLLRFIPGTAQDVRAYFLTLQYWLAGSDENIANMVRFLVNRYADGPRRALRGALKAPLPVEYPEVGVYHPRLPGRIGESVDALPQPPGGAMITVGLLVMRSYVLAGNAGHYDGVIAAIEARGMRVIPAFATGLDARPAIEKFFLRDGAPIIDAMASLTGFSLVGGPAYNDAKAAEEILAKLDIPFISAHPVEFQTLEQWRQSDRGLEPVEATIMVAIPELDGSTGPSIFGGRANGGSACDGCERSCVFPHSENARDMHVCMERAEVLAARLQNLAALRRSQRAARKVAIVLFNFPPNAGNTGTAAYLSVFESLHRVLLAMKQGGYNVSPPATVDELRASIVEGNSARYGALANVFARITAEDHLRREPWLKEIEAQWGPTPGRQQSDGVSIHVLGERFGNIFVGVQPAFGYEGDPMRLLFEKGFSPTHAFSAFYRYLREDFGADAVLHFGTHGALEFMPGKQTGLSASCWPDRLIGALPNFYLYASNNPSEGTIAKRRAAATLISYLTPPVANAGLYRGLVDLKASLDRWRSAAPEDIDERGELTGLIQTQAALLDLADAKPAWGEAADAQIGKLTEAMLELEYTLIPQGLHIVGEPLTREERIDMLSAMAEATHGSSLERTMLAALVSGADPATLTQDAETLEILRELAASAEYLAQDYELEGILHALDGRFVRPAPGGDLLRTAAVLPTGRNLHGFDPFRIPSAFALQDGARQAQRLLTRYMADGNSAPETIALVTLGNRQFEDRRGADRAGPCFDRSRAALRQLRSTGRRHSDPTGSTESSSH